MEVEGDVELWERKLLARQAELCQVLADASRLEILQHLATGEKTVSQLVELMELRQSNVSQHLAQLRQRGLVGTRRVGTTIFYSLVDPEIMQACAITRRILMRQLEASSELVGRVTAG